MPDFKPLKSIKIIVIIIEFFIVVYMKEKNK